MRQESRDLWSQALADLEGARSNLATGVYFVAAFLAHQAAEKALKAAFIEIHRQMPPRTHNLLDLGKAVQLSQDLTKPLRRLNPAYTTSRYPDAANGVPAETFDQEIAQGLVDDAQEVMDWAKEVLRER